MKKTGHTKVQLGEIATVFSGFAFKSSDLGSSGIPVIKIGNIQAGCVQSRCADHFPRELFTGKLNRYVLQQGDSLVAMTGAGSVGKFGRMLKVSQRFLVNQRVGIIRPDKAKCDPAFVFYVLSLPNYEKTLYAQGLGAGQPNVSAKQISDLEVPFPPLKTQRCIVSILSAYDDLIENNTRRIAILEEMARRIYEEWFVRFRFPGHEQVKMVESELGLIPEGWIAGKLGEHLISIESGKRPKGGISEIDEGVPSIGAENVISIGRHNFDSEKLISKEFFASMKKGVVADRDVAVYKDGAYIGRSTYFRDSFPHRVCAVNEHVFLLRSSGIHLTQNQLYLWLQRTETVDAIRATNANAAQPGINQKTVSWLSLVLPDKNLAASFDKTVEPMLASITNLAKKNRILRQTRDLLLPKLISGELDVSTLPEPEEAVAA
ncbi:restriction endonuclease subunit S [Azospira inquinata]|uniref:Restriction endonuclease subunit S n=1 Tax=Azospira inquinata TaxID=2785627 RepID=A0A975SPC5_9RHOO|nr:restriction endonuclease subunit S [Azospira inquinata]QWT47404.1 restriction endonuclease subunit S [Azospira inquinata]QWT49973.1 restriction endonuclease subunit S [Azospira inquinata]